MRLKNIPILSECDFRKRAVRRYISGRFSNEITFLCDFIFCQPFIRPEKIKAADLLAERVALYELIHNGEMNGTTRRLDFLSTCRRIAWLLKKMEMLEVWKTFLDGSKHELIPRSLCCHSNPLRLLPLSNLTPIWHLNSPPNEKSRARRKVPV